MANQDELSDEEIRFELLDEATKDELMANRKAKNTNRVTKQWFSCLKAFLKERKLPDLESIPDTDLPQILGEFYYSARKQKITDTEKFNEAQNDPKKKSALKHYKNSSLKSGRAALNRYFKGERGLDIISNELFIKANENFQSVTKKGKEDGRGEISSKIPISDEDMEKLSLYFQEKMMGKANGKFLQQLVVFNIIYQGGRRGHEYLRNMKKDTFEIKTDHDGRKYTVQVVKELTKNHQADDTSETNEARIYELKGKYHENSTRLINSDINPVTNNSYFKHFNSKQQNFSVILDSDICPVNAYLLMKEKLNPNLDDLFQRPKKVIKNFDEEWYDAVPVGRDPLNNAMKNLSKDAGLSRIYTNHCIRATVVTNLNEKGFEARDIMATTGHKSEASIRSYAKKCPEKRRKEMSDALSSKMSKPSATATNPSESECWKQRKHFRWSWHKRFR